MNERMYNRWDQLVRQRVVSSPPVQQFSLDERGIIRAVDIDDSFASQLRETLKAGGQQIKAPETPIDPNCRFAYQYRPSLGNDTNDVLVPSETDINVKLTGDVECTERAIRIAQRQREIRKK